MIHSVIVYNEKYRDLFNEVDEAIKASRLAAPKYFDQEVQAGRDAIDKVMKETHIKVHHSAAHTYFVLHGNMVESDRVAVVTFAPGVPDVQEEQDASDDTDPGSKESTPPENENDAPVGPGPDQDLKDEKIPEKETSTPEPPAPPKANKQKSDAKPKSK